SCQFRLNSFRNANRFNGVLHVVQKYGELIATKPGQIVVIVIGQPARYVGQARTRDRVDPAHRIPQSLRDLNQQIVAGSVSQAVIDDFELVDINEQHGEFVVRVPFGESESVLQPVEEQGSVRQVRESVVECVVGQRFFG